MTISGISSIIISLLATTAHAGLTEDVICTVNTESRQAALLQISLDERQGISWSEQYSIRDSLDQRDKII